MSDAAAISIRQLKKVYGVRSNIFGKALNQVTALDDIEMNLCLGGIYAIVGESGSGKSTLARILTRLEKQSFGRVDFTGEAFSKPLSSQMVFQNPFASLNPKWKIRDSIAEGLKNEGRCSAEIERELTTIMLDTQLPLEMLEKYPHQLSGGECQRVALARALVLKPTLLVLDEVTSSLDLPTQGRILDLIGKLITKRKMIVVFISHDLSVVKKMADYVYVLKEGKLVEEGKVSDVISSPQHAYTKILLNAARSCGVKI